MNYAKIFQLEYLSSLTQRSSEFPEQGETNL